LAFTVETFLEIKGFMQSSRLVWFFVACCDSLVVLAIIAYYHIVTLIYTVAQLISKGACFLRDGCIIHGAPRSQIVAVGQLKSGLENRYFGVI